MIRATRQDAEINFDDALRQVHPLAPSTLDIPFCHAIIRICVLFTRQPFAPQLRDCLAGQQPNSMLNIWKYMGLVG